MEHQQNYLFHSEHLWVRKIDDHHMLVGISNYAKGQLGDIVFVDFPDVGSEIVQGVPFGVVESMKVVSDLIAPVCGTVIETNEQLQEEIALINDDPQGGGWILRIKLTDPSQLSALLSDEQYAALRDG